MKNKVMLVNWPLLDVGGITTWAHQIMQGYRQIGWEAHHYYCTPTGRTRVSEDSFTFIGKKFKRGEKIPSRSLGYAGPENLQHFKKLSREYDYVLFVHPSPHPTKGNTLMPGMEDWKRLYRACSVPVVVVFHDKKWRKNNAWFLDVADYVDVVLAAQHNFLPMAEDYANERTGILCDWLYFPLNLEDCTERKALSGKRDKQFCMMPQWQTLKRHRFLVPELPKIEWPVHLYNGGQQYHFLAKTPEWFDGISKDHVTHTQLGGNQGHEYHGFVTYDTVKHVYQKSVASIDLTIKPYSHYTHVEGGLHGCVLCCTEECRKGPYNEIPEGGYWTIDRKDIAGSLNRFSESSPRTKSTIRKTAFQFVTENYDCRVIADKINSMATQVRR